MTTFQEVDSLVRFDAETGLFTWKVDRPNHKKAGDSAGYRRKDGYIILVLNEKHLLGHRVAILLASGEWPEGEVDHIDGNPFNNSLSNLRVVSRSQNTMNTKLLSANTSGVKGVSFYSAGKCWEAYITKDLKRRRLGYFRDFDDAVAARRAAEREMFGEYARAS